MDKDKAIEAARTFIRDVESGKYYNKPISTLDCYKALKEALEEKPSREECIEWLKAFKSHKLANTTIELLKQPAKPAREWVENTGIQPERGIVAARLRNGKLVMRYCSDLRWDLDGFTDNVVEYTIIE